VTTSQSAQSPSARRARLPVPCDGSVPMSRQREPSNGCGAPARRPPPPQRGDPAATDPGRCAPSIFRDKNRRRVGKFQPKRTHKRTQRPAHRRAAVVLALQLDPGGARGVRSPRRSVTEADQVRGGDAAHVRTRELEHWSHAPPGRIPSASMNSSNKEHPPGVAQCILPGGAHRPPGPGP
jgi:hypothetical protein